MWMGHECGAKRGIHGREHLWETSEDANEHGARGEEPAFGRDGGSFFSQFIINSSDHVIIHVRNSFLGVVVLIKLKISF